MNDRVACSSIRVHIGVREPSNQPRAINPEQSTPSNQPRAINPEQSSSVCTRVFSNKGYKGARLKPLRVPLPGSCFPALHNLSNTFMASGLVTGCGKGIGLATVARLLRQGDQVVGISRSLTPGISGLLRKFKSTFYFLECDISDKVQLSKSIAESISILSVIDYAIANAGIRSRCSIQESSLDLYSKVFDINTLSQVHLTKCLVQHSVACNTSLKLLYITSIVGVRGFSDLSTYACSKSALEGFVRSLAVEYARHNILVNCVAPGFIKSSYYKTFKQNNPQLHAWTLERTPMGRWGTCHEIAKLISFLVSSQNSYMTGTTIYCDGGWTAA